MLVHLPLWLAAPLAYLLYLGNSFVCITPLLLLALAKLLVPVAAWRRHCDRGLEALGRCWICGSNLLTRVLYRIEWRIEGARPLDPDGWYLVVANHQSWVDLVVFIRVFGHTLPFPRVFAKRETLWIPFLGLAIWAMGFPLVKRYPRALLERRPELRNVDRAITLRACRAALRQPTTMVNFLEGTRFTPAKQARQQSPYRHLLRPKAGGAALVIESFGPRLTGFYDLSIAYPDGTPSFWRFLGGRLPRVTVRLREVPVPEEFRSAHYAEDEAARARFQAWVAELWREKDAWIDRVLLAAAEEEGAP